MIANITTGSFLKGLFDYNQKKVKEGKAQTLLVNVCDNNEKTAQNLMLSIANQSKRKHKFFHASLNFPSEDRNLLSNSKMTKIAQDYMFQMGFPKEHPIVIYKHEDTEHPHLHIVTSQILWDGKPLPDNNNRYRSQKITRQLETKYQLTKVSSYKKKNNKIDQKRNLKNDILTAVDNINKTFHPKDITELNHYLNKVQLGLTVLPKEKKHRENNETYNLVYHRVGDNNKRLDKGIISSALGTEHTYSSVDRKLKKNTPDKTEKNKIRKDISLILAKFSRLDIEDFKTHLKGKHIDLNYKYDSKQNLVGISFTNAKTGRKFTGEQLGTKFKSKALREKLTIGITLQHPSELTRSSLQPMRKYLSKLDIGPLVQQLLKMGYYIHESKDQLYVSDYRNSKGKGYIPIRKLEHPLNHNIVKLYNVGEQNYFIYSDRDKIFEEQRVHFISNSIADLSSKSIQNNQEYNSNSTSGSILQSSKPQHDDFVPLEQLADIDKRKKKKKGKKI